MISQQQLKLDSNQELDSHACGLLQGTSSIQPPAAPLIAACCVSVLHTFGEPAQSCDNLGSESALRHTHSLDARPALGAVPRYTRSRTFGRNARDIVSVHCAQTSTVRTINSSDVGVGEAAAATVSTDAQAVKALSGSVYNGMEAESEWRSQIGNGHGSMPAARLLSGAYQTRRKARLVDIRWF
jgi:hypothetical protein